MKKLLLIFMFLPFIGFGQSDIFGEKTGCISGDCVNGYGTYIFSNGSKYVGEFKNKWRHGQGTHTPVTGTVKRGEWINDKYQKPKTSNTNIWKPPVKAVCNRKSKIAIAD